MILMDDIDKLLRSIIISDEEFRKTLNIIIREKYNNTLVFSKISGISASTLYKILSGERRPNIKTLRKICLALEKDKSEKGRFIAIIAARSVLDETIMNEITVNGTVYKIKEYAAFTVEDAIISAIKAERDGAAGLVCAPIVSPTIEKIVSIPVSVIIPRESINRAIEVVAKKIRR